MKKKLLKSTLIFSLMTFISRLAGLGREMVFAYFFGATPGFDAFNIAYRIPNFLRGLVGEGAFSQAFVPVLTAQKVKQDFAATKLFLDHMAGLILLSLSIVTVVAILIAPWLVYIFAPGFIGDPGRFALTSTMLKITFPYILFISFTAYVSGILNSYGKFGVPALAPIFLNLSLIGSAIFLAPYCAQPIVALAWGVFIGGILQLFFQLPFLLQLKLLPRPKISWSDKQVKQVLKLMVPAIFGVSVAQVGFLINNLLASFLPPGTIGWLNYANRLTLFPLGIFGVAVATVVLPYMSSSHISQAADDFWHTFDWALKFVLVIVLPATIGITMLAGPIIMTLFQLQHGKFLATDVIMVRQTLWGFSCGLPAFMLIKILAAVFYAKKDIKTPVKLAGVAVVANIILSCHHE
jgi:putative peptidoglycan lipid II flippase